MHNIPAEKLCFNSQYYAYIHYKTYLIENVKTVGIKIDRNSCNCELSPHSYAYRNISVIRLKQ